MVQSLKKNDSLQQPLIHDEDAAESSSDSNSSSRSSSSEHGDDDEDDSTSDDDDDDDDDDDENDENNRNTIEENETMKEEERKVKNKKNDNEDNEAENFNLEYYRSLVRDKKLAFNVFLCRESSADIQHLSKTVDENEQKKTSTVAVSSLVRERVLALKSSFNELRTTIETTRLQKEASRLNRSSETSFADLVVHERRLLEKIRSLKLEHRCAVGELKRLKQIAQSYDANVQKSRSTIKRAFECWFLDLLARVKFFANAEALRIVSVLDGA